MRRQLSFANVVALLALFIALGGTSWAALKITGKNVQNGTLSGKDVRRNSLGGRVIAEGKLGRVPHAARADRATNAGRAESAAGADTLGGQPPAAYAAAARFLHTGLLRFGVGESRVVLTRGPLSFRFTCVDGIGDALGTQMAVNSAEAGLMQMGNSSGLLPITESLGAGSQPSNLPAGTDVALLQRNPTTQLTYDITAGYIDLPSGLSMEYSARVRTKKQGAACTLILQGSFSP